MSRLRLALACGPYEHTRALAEGGVEIDGVDLVYLTLSPEEIFWRMLRFEEFDVSELSLSSYSILRSRGDQRFVALPVFPSRLFRHSAIYVREGHGLRDAADLRGRRIGVPEYEMTASVWVRGFLQDDFGVRPADVHWFTGGLEQAGREEKVPVAPPGVRIQPIQRGETLSAMLLRGDLEAVISARAPTAFLEHRGIVRLLADHAAIERDYYRRTRAFPIMHTLVLRRAVFEGAPWLATSLFQAFCAARDAWLDHLYEGTISVVGLPWLPAFVEEVRGVMGDDLWPYGLEANRPTLETFLRYETEQGLLSRPLNVEELFAPSTLQGYRV